jgi:hypothetical protein
MPVELILVTTSDQVRQSLTRFNAEARRVPARARKLLSKTEHWVYDDDSENFGPAKFVGFADMSFAKYEEAIKHNRKRAPFTPSATRGAIKSALVTSFSSNEQLRSKLEGWGKSLLGSGAFDGVDQSKWTFVRLKAQHSGRSGERPPSEAAVEAAVAVQAKNQGFQMDSAVRQALEEHAMKRAEAHFVSLFDSVKRKGKPYDLCCTNKSSVLYVEVKGTQTEGTEILLTPNEVDFARKHRGEMALFLVYNIAVAKEDGKIVASGGSTHIDLNWVIDDTGLSPLGYSYSLSGKQ